jgi:hypothetical protein
LISFLILLLVQEPQKCENDNSEIAVKCYFYNGEAVKMPFHERNALAGESRAYRSAFLLQSAEYGRKNFLKRKKFQSFTSQGTREEVEGLHHQILS